MTEQPSSEVSGEGEDGIPTEGVEMAPKRAVTQSLQVLASAGRLVSAWREVPGELSDSPSPELRTPKAGPVRDPGLRTASSHLQGQRVRHRISAVSAPAHGFLGSVVPSLLGWGLRRKWNPLPSRILTTSVCTGSAWAADVVSTDCSSRYSPLFPRLGICFAPWR